MSEAYAVINGHRVVDLPRLSAGGRFGSGPVCLSCDTHFTDRLAIEETPCPVNSQARGHDLIVDPDDGLLYCTRCPLVAYDLADVASEPPCEGPVHGEQPPWTRPAGG